MHINLLHEEVMGDILSLLPTKLAASTSVLSKKWRNVFALVHNLDFDDSVLLQQEEGKEEMDETRECFKNFFDRILALQCGSHIKKFSLKCHLHYGWEMGYVNPWIYDVVDRGVSELVLSIKTRYYLNRVPSLVIGPQHNRAIYLRSELFTCKTLVKLTLGTQIDIGPLPPDVHLPALKSLFIDSIIFIGEDLDKVLLLGCPVLEELTVRHEELPWCIFSKTIKKLLVYFDCKSEIDFIDGLSFDAPNMLSLDYFDYALYGYPQVNLGSLVEAKLDIRYSGEQIKRPDLSGLTTGIRNVQTLDLTPASTDISFPKKNLCCLFVCSSKTYKELKPFLKHVCVFQVIARCVKHGLVLPVFVNLVKLSFGSKNKRGWRLLTYLLKQCPKLETLTIEGLDGYTADVTIRPFQVKVLHVLDYKRTAKEFHQLRSFLGGTECLEVLQVEIARDVVVDDGKVNQTCNDLRALLGVSVSSKCKINVAYYM